ncbi:nuclear transport factor 2 family protein [Spirillospora sp. NPDC029432]|uniref:nuclear transport factor 2 family protein n=1 Tax=Spirillospora sp. NPDC029432 TaxID=3154599 RepID=UPI0034524313
MSADIEALERRIARLEAVEAIKALKYRYWRSCDGKDPEAFRSCFVRKGASVDYGRLGRFDDADPIAEIFADVALLRRDGRYVILDMHHGLHPEITLHGDGTAAGRWTLRFRQINLAEGTETVMTGEYDDRYVVEDGEWRMSQSHFAMLWSRTLPLPAEARIAP